MNRTDLAFEALASRRISHSGNGVNIKKSDINNLPFTEIKLDKKNAAGKPKGIYTTLFCTDRDEKTETEALFRILRDFVPETGRILAAGLGNANITPDSLGVRTASRITPTAHFRESQEFADLGMREVYVVETGVLAQTGMESGEQLAFITNGVKPALVLVIDSLACAEPDRLGRTIQITDAGIAPGSGVGNTRREVSAKTLGVPVVAVGVPTANIMRV
ncbi:MAG: GPR endopeptidase [Oscillospiraceae bacterium]|nr:GPR endopeptidase [Oscillospiraceae bacterium]